MMSLLVWVCFSPCQVKEFLAWLHTDADPIEFCVGGTLQSQNGRPQYLIKGALVVDPASGRGILLQNTITVNDVTAAAYIRHLQTLKKGLGGTAYGPAKYEGAGAVLSTLSAVERAFNGVGLNSYARVQLAGAVPPTDSGILQTVTTSAMRDAKEIEHDDLGASPVQGHANGAYTLVMRKACCANTWDIFRDPARPLDEQFRRTQDLLAQGSEFSGGARTANQIDVRIADFYVAQHEIADNLRGQNTGSEVTFLAVAPARQKGSADLAKMSHSCYCPHPGQSPPPHNPQPTHAA